MRIKYTAFLTGIFTALLGSSAVQIALAHDDGNLCWIGGQWCSCDGNQGSQGTPAVPEPSSLTILAIGAVVLVAVVCARIITLKRQTPKLDSQ